MINLQSHTVYPEIQTNTDTGQWIGILYARNGEVKERFAGQVDVKGKSVQEIRKAASMAAHAKFNIVIQKYEV